MAPERDEAHLAASVAQARKATLTFGLRHAGIDYLISTREALNEFERDAGYEGDRATQIWQLLLSIDDLRVSEGRTWQDVFVSGDASARLDARNLVRALHGLCLEEGIDFGALLGSIDADIHHLRPGREQDWPGPGEISNLITPIEDRRSPAPR
jgi:hypothetical protein